MKSYDEPFIDDIAKEVTKCTLCSADGYLCKIHAQIVTTNIMQSSTTLLSYLRNSSEFVCVKKSH